MSRDPGDLITVHDGVPTAVLEFLCWGIRHKVSHGAGPQEVERLPFSLGSPSPPLHPGGSAAQEPLKIEQKPGTGHGGWAVTLARYVIESKHAWDFVG